MADDGTQITGDQTAQTSGGQASQTPASLNIPPDVAEKFADLIELIKFSRSMDDGERQYWIDVLPIMSDDQIQNLRNILDNEKKQLAQAQAVYSEGMNTAVKQAAAAFDEQAYLEKKRTREEAEKRTELQEKTEEEQVLAELGI